MKTWQITRFGIDALELVERPVPAPGPGEVLVRWRAQSLNYRDLIIVDGSYIPQLPLPFTPLSDGAGEITAVGAGVTAWKPGDRVIGHYIQSWLDGAPTPENTRLSLGAPLPGVLTEYSVLPEHGLVPLPAHLTFEEGATLPIAALTAWNALFIHGDVAPGSTVLLEGTGGVSLFALQLAHAAGLRTIIISSSDEKLARARTLGADETINYRTVPAWSRRVRKLTNGAGVDLVLDIGGPATFTEALRAVRLGGRIAVIGFLSGTALELDTIEFMRTLATMHGIRVGSRAMFRDLLRALERHRLKPVIDREFSLTEAPAAFRHLASGAHFGKVVIRTGE
ncbi:MAG: NAD(P)-dependent alcohol dehydrogenase [Opitutae bacterium]|nr:NAD(P)-dependent alcohol dehydrogenase [Opitutae bacterium]